MRIALGGRGINKKKPISQQLTKKPLEISYTAHANIFYTIMMYDPNAARGTYLHYLVINVPGTNIARGQTIFSYQPPSPPAGTGIHRYVIDVYASQTPINLDAAAIVSEGRSPFDVESFVNE